MEMEQAYRLGSMYGRITFFLVAALVVMIFAAGCTKFELSDTGDELTYDICDDTMLPDELVTIINAKKEKPFNLVYSNSTYTYIVLAAGIQERDDVEVSLSEMYKDDNAIYVKGVLKQKADSSGSQVADTGGSGVDGDGVSYPYIVIRIIKMDLPVVFK